MIREAIAEVLPLAVGVALSPVPIIAVVLMLVTPRARANGPAFVVGWLVGLGLVGAIVLLLSNGADANDDGDPAPWVGVLKLLLGAGLLLVALRQWRSRPGEGEEPAPPKWMGAIEGFTPPKALGAGAALGGANPKNLLLAVGAAAAIAELGMSGGDEALAYAVFTVIGTIGVGAPVVIFFALGDRSRDLLARLQAWMGHNNAAIMAVLCLVIGAKLVGDGIAGL